MQRRNGVDYFSTPKYLPTKWLIACFVALTSLLGSTFYFGVAVQNIDSRISAQELHSEIIDRRMVYDQTALDKVSEELKSINSRLGRIEGGIEMLRRQR